MKRIVIYKSSTGFTKKYAEWISKALECEILELKKVSNETVNKYDVVIFGGWIMGNMINGLDKVIKMNCKNLVVFAVGSTPNEIVNEDIIKEQNNTGDLPVFYMVGGFKFEKIALPIRMMLKSIKKSTAKKENKSEQEKFMAEHLGTSFDYSDKKYIEPLVSAVDRM